MPHARRPRATLHRSVAPGIHRLEHACTNSYLVEDEDRLTLVDAGLPATHGYLLQAIAAIGREPEDLVALVITHAHFDHLGVAARLRAATGCRVLVHDEDAELAEHPYRYLHERPRSRYPLRYPAALPALASMTAAGALWVRGTTRTEALPGSGTLDVPGSPTVVFTPGHTFGHCALDFPDRGAVIAGDALVTLDPYTGETGPRVVAGAATANARLALESLDALAALGTRTLLPGHGRPWRGDLREAVQAAHRAGVA
ncbi:MBL fold metallo-hydrolase [Plantibacter cousiniae (nom. nud.)]|uniref:Glyoxylase, beta-lactamase superfamily II n=1 Tax=Plantibacter cousiniae (nom. nud.) TaxID=199709 RepID=A0ABY1LHV6_9MICO|nr:MBL fold metallo-hydrolase [Plantibacter cousiniae]SKC42314.1 Glyoxylase, beta-lactamase superfamily II [Plantibacter cousiniae]